MLERAVAAAVAAHQTPDEVRSRIEAVLTDYEKYASPALIAAEDIETGRYSE